MASFINRNNYSNQRDTYLRFISTALEALAEENPTNETYKDKWVFIYLTLIEIQKLLQKTTQPWEKRGYWLKVEQFRAEWGWLDELIPLIGYKISHDEWASLAQDKEKLEEICKNFPAYQRLQVREPWLGALKKWKNKKAISS